MIIKVKMLFYKWTKIDMKILRSFDTKIDAEELKLATQKY
jgi:hypothetical protein